MNKKCEGCGVYLQTNNNNQPGYIRNINNELCDRCYQIKNFNKDINNNFTINEIKNIIINNIKNYEDVILVIDICNFNASFNKDLLNILKDKNIIVLVNKMDIFPKIVNHEKIKKWIKNNLPVNIKEIFLVSATKKMHIDNVLNYLKKTNIKTIPILGMTNVGKSSLLNAIINSVEKNQKQVMVSYYKNTTLGIIKRKISGIEFLDFPGLINITNIQNYLDVISLKKVYPKKEYQQKIYQIKPHNALIISSVFNIEILESENLSISVFTSNQINIHRCKSDNIQTLLATHQFSDFFTLPLQAEKDNFGSFQSKIITLAAQQMIYINGLCFMTFNNKKPIKIKLNLRTPISYGIYPSIFKE